MTDAISVLKKQSQKAMESGDEPETMQSYMHCFWFSWLTFRSSAFVVSLLELQVAIHCAVEYGPRWWSLRPTALIKNLDPGENMYG
jgi:hypothetical protein